MANAWCQTIEQPYRQQLINSERGLQVFFCSALMEAFKEDGVRRRIFVEPRLSVDARETRRYPDIVICNKRSVIGVVELKYLPKGRPRYQKDLDTLEFAASGKAGLTITSRRFLGINKLKTAYPLARDCVLCWAGVYTGGRLNLHSQVSDVVSRRFLQLDAITQAKRNPKIYLK